MAIIGSGIIGTFLNSNTGSEVYDYTGTGYFVDVNYSRGTNTTYNKRYMRWAYSLAASELSGISGRRMTTIRITSNKNQNIDYNSIKIYMKHNGIGGVTANALNISGLSPYLTLTSGTLSGWTARGNYYYIDFPLDDSFVWDGVSSIRFYYDYDVPNPSYSGADTSNYVAYVNVGSGSEWSNWVNSSTPLGDNPAQTYTWSRKLVNYLTFD